MYSRRHRGKPVASGAREIRSAGTRVPTEHGDGNASPRYLQAHRIFDFIRMPRERYGFTGRVLRRYTELLKKIAPCAKALAYEETPATGFRRRTEEGEGPRVAARENHLGPVRPVVWLSLALLALTNRYIAGVITQCTPHGHADVNHRGTPPPGTGLAPD
ncbi:hypothetical protein Q5P01_000532 [Channa striata]|uniref:Uncharacterized protein n=1 Tax=Channa striata TaxID=64152 RepID=A0AA88LEV1_CHASR|nr:hypothetical protein Q5P01_000532 [Channa striata]